MNTSGMTPGIAAFFAQDARDMALLDYFAAVALGALIQLETDESMDDTAALAYSFAMVMMSKREAISKAGA